MAMTIKNWMKDEDGQLVERTMTTADDWSEILGDINEDEWDALYDWITR